MDILREMQECQRLRNEGRTQIEISKILGLSTDQVFRRLRSARKSEGLDPTLLSRLHDSGIKDLAGLHSGWLIDKDQDGSGKSLYFYLGPDGEKLSPEEYAEIFVNALENMRPAEPVHFRQRPIESHVGLVADSDWHFGASISAGEAGLVYNREIALERLRRGTAQCHAAMPSCAECIVLNLGDRTHADNDFDETPRSKHKLKVEGSHHENITLSVDATAWQIDYALQHHETIRYIAKRGNHDPNTPTPHLLAMKYRYQNEPRVIIEENNSPFFVYQKGKLFIVGHHGHGQKPKELAHDVKHTFRREYGRSDYHYLLTGHRHNEVMDTFGGLRWFQLPSLCTLEQYSTEMGFADTSGMVSFVFDTEEGMKSHLYACI